MAKGKSKKVPKKDKAGKKGDKHTFAKKEWFTVLAPSAVKSPKAVGWTCCKKPQGTQIVADFLKGRVAEIAYADINEESAPNQINPIFKHIHAIVDEVQGGNCFTSFYKYELTRDKIFGLIRKRQTLVEVNTEVKTLDGQTYRIFLVIVSTRVPRQVKENSYLKQSKVKQIRKKMIADLIKIASERKADDFVYSIITESLKTQLQKTVVKFHPGCKVEIAKIKTVKRGNVDIKALVEETKAVAAPVEEEAPKTVENPEAQNPLSKQDE